MGAGWFIQGTRNMFIGCTAQENAGHGWLVEWATTSSLAAWASLPASRMLLPALLEATRRRTGTLVVTHAVAACGSSFAQPYSWAKAPVRFLH